LRLSVGRSAVSDGEIRSIHAAAPLLHESGVAVPADELAVANGLFLSLDLRGEGSDGWVGYRARENTEARFCTVVRSRASPT